VQDSVITLALAEEAAGRMTASTGRMMGVIGT